MLYNKIYLSFDDLSFEENGKKSFPVSTNWLIIFYSTLIHKKILSILEEFKILIIIAIKVCKNKYFDIIL